MDARRRLLSGGLTLGKLAIGAYTAPTYVVLTEDGVDTDYILLKHEYPAASGGGSLLRRKEYFYNGVYDSLNSNTYSSCTMKSSMITNLVPKFTASIQGALITAAVPMGGGNTLSLKVFVLSGTELGLSDTYMTVAGSAIAYFSGDAARTTGYTSWTRSAVTSGSNTVYRVSSTGTRSTGQADTTATGNPCIVLPASTRVRLSSGKYYV